MIRNYIVALLVSTSGFTVTSIQAENAVWSTIKEEAKKITDALVKLGKYTAATMTSNALAQSGIYTATFGGSLYAFYAAYITMRLGAALLTIYVVQNTKIDYLILSQY